MLESFVSTILNRYLGQYVNNLDPDQLRLAVWSGASAFEAAERREGEERVTEERKESERGRESEE